MINTLTTSSINEISNILERNSIKIINFRQELLSKYSYENGFLKITNQFLNDLLFDFKIIIQALDRFKNSNINLSNNLQQALIKNNDLNLIIQNLKNHIYSLETNLLNSNHQIQDLTLLNNNHENYIEELVYKLNISKEKPYLKPNCCLCDCIFCQNNYNIYKSKFCPVDNSYENEMNSTNKSTLINDVNKINNNNNTNNNYLSLNNPFPENNTLLNSNNQFNINNNSNNDSLNFQNSSIKITPLQFFSNFNSNVISNNNRNTLELNNKVNISNSIKTNNIESNKFNKNYNINDNMTKNLNNKIISSFPSKINIKKNLSQQTNEMIKSKSQPNIINIKKENNKQIIKEVENEEQKKKVKLENMKEKINRIEKIVQNALKDEKIIKYLNIKLGENFTEKLTQGDVTEEYLNQIENAIEDFNEQENINNNLKDKNNKITNNFLPKKKFKNSKENNEYNKMKLKRQITDLKYHYKEYPRPWNSTNDYFTNNNSSNEKIGKNKIKIPNYPK